LLGRWNASVRHSLCFPLNETRSIAQGAKKQRIFFGRRSFGFVGFVRGRARSTTLPGLLPCVRSARANEGEKKKDINNAAEAQCAFVFSRKSMVDPAE